MGLTALPALTLLECGVPADDARIQKALKHVRTGIPRLSQTYELALVILFLDRAGEPADIKRIQTCALRLVAGQSPAGGWTYGCPILTPKQESDLLMVMRDRRPRSSLDLFTRGPGGSAPPGFLAGDPGAGLDKGLQGESSADSRAPPRGRNPLSPKGSSQSRGSQTRPGSSADSTPEIAGVAAAREVAQTAASRYDRTTRTRSLPSLDCWRPSNTICRWNGPAL